MKPLSLTFAFLAGCTINVIDDRLSRDEVSEAFKKRDETLSVLITDYNARTFPEGTPTPEPTISAPQLPTPESAL
jgi:hypothetical protein